MEGYEDWKGFEGSGWRLGSGDLKFLFNDYQ
jgi:hypothetical protein